VVARSVDLAGEAVDLGPGISVLPGASADTVWVVTSAGRRVRLVTVPSGMDVVDEPIERGRPLAGGPEGLVLAPRSPGEPFEVWQPHRIGAPVHVLAGSEGGALLGLGGDRVVIAVDDRLLVYEIDPSLGDSPAIEASTEALFVSDSVVESALSPDGRHLAVGRLTTITEPDVVEIIAVGSGEVVRTLRPALGLSFSWIDADRLAYVTPGGGRFRLVAAPVDGGEATILLESADLDWFHQFVPIG
jgi:hypothetical protein